MAKVSEIVSLFVLISIWHTICGQPFCWNSPCSCCKNNKCETNNNNRCTDGCIDGFWGSQCYNDCPTNCVACTSQTNCNACVDGRYGTSCDSYCRSRCLSCTGYNNCDKCVDGRYGTLCRGYCRSECVSCINYDNCGECVHGHYGTTCRDKCPSGCENGVCDKIDGKCKCKAGYTSSFCRCASNEFGQNPDCFACPDKCLTCSSNTECSKCIAGLYGSTCMNNCSTLCKDSLCKIDGSCIFCPDGYYGSGCLTECLGQCKTCLAAHNCTECTSGLFGIMCTEACPEKCTDCTSSTACNTCQPGFKGKTCQNHCTNCKPGTKCDQISGRCDTCIDGKYGPSCTQQCYSKCKSCDRDDMYKCTDCPDGKYGLTSNCTNTCQRNNCFDDKCDAITGFCSSCKEGYTGTYGRCPVTCETCDTNGYCKSCSDGYENINKYCECRHDKCFTSGCEQCNDIKWYPDVKSQSCCQCSSNCKRGQCLSDKECSSGCEDGYFGNACDKLCSIKDSNCLQCTTGNDGYSGCSKCLLGYYPGTNYCQGCYSNCRNTNCDQTSGICLDGCQNGFWGYTCESSCSDSCFICNQETSNCEVCTNGKYTKECSKSCSETCNVLDGEELKCRINDGACLDGCISTTLFGLQCNENCSSNCKGKECEWKTGNCLKCVANKYGPRCGDECNNNCILTSTQDSQLTRCYGENGTCITGCISGFYGYKCEKTCSQFCKNTTCGRLNGACLHGCIDWYTAATCTQALVSSDPVTEYGPGAAIGGAVGGIIVVVILIVIAVVFLIRRRRGSNSKYPSTHSNDEIQNKPKDMSDPVHNYYNTNESVQEPETTHEYEELDIVPHNMQRSVLSADHHGDGDVIERGDVNTYEPLSRQEINTDVYSQLEHSAYENTTI